MQAIPGYPSLPEVPDVVPFEDEPAKEALRRWAVAYAIHCLQYAYEQRETKAEGVVVVPYCYACLNRPALDYTQARPA